MATKIKPIMYNYWFVFWPFLSIKYTCDRTSTKNFTVSIPFNQLDQEKLNNLNIEVTEIFHTIQKVFPLWLSQNLAFSAFNKESIDFISTQFDKFKLEKDLINNLPTNENKKKTLKM